MKSWTLILPIALGGAACLLLPRHSSVPHRAAPSTNTAITMDAPSTSLAEMDNASAQNVPAPNNEAPWAAIRTLLNQDITPADQGKLAILLSRAAVLDGAQAMELLLDTANEPLLRAVFPTILDVWADVKPIEALHWFHDAAQDDLATEGGYEPNPTFYEKTFRAEFQEDIATAAKSLVVISNEDGRLAAIAAMLNVATETEALPSAVENLGSYGELRPIEVALISATVNDPAGYLEATADLSAQELKTLVKLLPLGFRGEAGSEPLPTAEKAPL